MPTTRRSFLAASSSLLAGLFLPRTRLEPDTILYNGNVWTVDDAVPRAQAVAISDGRIFAIGSNDDVLRLASPVSRKFDLGWKTVLPGFNDAHAHPIYSGVEHLKQVACDKDSIEAIQQALRARASKTLAGAWVLGFLYDDGKTTRPLNRQDLDAAVPDHPVLVAHRGGHTIFVNSEAFKIAGVDESTPDPPGGRYGRDASGKLNGFVADAAAERFRKLVPSEMSRDDLQKGAALISKMFTS